MPGNGTAYKYATVLVATITNNALVNRCRSNAIIRGQMQIQERLHP